MFGTGLFESSGAFQPIYLLGKWLGTKKHHKILSDQRLSTSKLTGELMNHGMLQIPLACHPNQSTFSKCAFKYAHWLRLCTPSSRQDSEDWFGSTTAGTFTFLWSRFCGTHGQPSGLKRVESFHSRNCIKLHRDTLQAQKI